MKNQSKFSKFFTCFTRKKQKEIIIEAAKRANEEQKSFERLLTPIGKCKYCGGKLAIIGCENVNCENNIGKLRAERIDATKITA